MNLTAKLGTAALALTAAGYVFVQNRWLTTNEYDVTVPDLPPAFDGKRILHLSDLHKKRYGDGFNNLINSCSFLEPDYVFFTGDLFSRDETNLDPKILLMQRLMKLAPVYYVLGNHETDAPNRAHALCEKLRREGVHIMNDRTERIEIGDEHINITGVVLPSGHYRNRNMGFSGRIRITPELLRERIGEPEKGGCNILLAHDPLPFDAYNEWGASVTFSGHIHGGVIRLPMIGGLLSPERCFFPKYSKGVYLDGDHRLVVSAGLGKFRLNNPSQIILVTLKRC